MQTNSTNSWPGGSHEKASVQNLVGRTSNRKRNLSGNLEPNPNPNPTSLPSNDPLPENNEVARSEFNKIVSRAHWCKARGAVRTNVCCRGSSRRRCVVGDRRQKLRGSISIQRPFKRARSWLTSFRKSQIADKLAYTEPPLGTYRSKRTCNTTPITPPSPPSPSRICMDTWIGIQGVQLWEGNREQD